MDHTDENGSSTTSQFVRCLTQFVQTFDFNKIIWEIFHRENDENSRLRRLNVHCLVHIFQYLSTGDLLTLSEMNEFYNQIILNFVIPKHNVTLICKQVFKKYETNIRKISVSEDEFRTITQYCSMDQLKSVDYCYAFLSVSLPIQFGNIESLQLFAARRLRLDKIEKFNRTTFAYC